MVLDVGRSRCNTVVRKRSPPDTGHTAAAHRVKAPSRRTQRVKSPLLERAAGTFAALRVVFRSTWIRTGTGQPYFNGLPTFPCRKEQFQFIERMGGHRCSRHTALVLVVGVVMMGAVVLAFVFVRMLVLVVINNPVLESATAPPHRGTVSFSAS